MQQTPTNHLHASKSHPESTVTENASTETICHGKVTDVFSLVKDDWWKGVFDHLYLKTDGDVCEDEVVTQMEVALLEKDSVVKKSFQSRGRVLDLCCGQGRHSLLLSSLYPNLEIHGIDQSAFLIQIAKERSKTKQKPPAFSVADCTQIPYPDDFFDLILILGNSFGYFSSEDGDRQMLAEVQRVMKKGARMVLDLTDGEYMRHNFQDRSWEWIDNTTFVCRERQLSHDGLRLASREVITETTKGVIRDQFYQERLYCRSELSAMVSSAGLSVVSDSSNMTVAGEMSQRQEDLGMMGNRMIITAYKPVSFQHSITNESVVMKSSLNITTNPIDNSSGYLEISDSIKMTESIACVERESVTTVDSSTPVSSTLHDSISSADSTSTPNSVTTGDSVNTHQNNTLFDSIVVLLGDPTQKCIGKLNDQWNDEDFLTRQKLFDALEQLGYSKKDKTLQVLDNHVSLYTNLTTISSSRFIFNLCDEGFHNDALKELHVPAMLEILSLPYSGAGPNCLAFCYDKGLVNRTAESLGVPTPKEVSYITKIHDLETLHNRVITKVGYPAFIKPIKGDNSLGITSKSIVHNENELLKYIAELETIGIPDVVVQEYLTGTEYGIGMVGNISNGFHFFPILEVDFTNITDRNMPPILGYESKWDPTSPYWSEIKYKRANLDKKVVLDLQKRCVALWERFGCRDYARFDFRAGGDGEIKLLEVNPNPGWCWDGKFAYMGKLENKSYKDVLGMILKAAHERIIEKC